MSTEGTQQQLSGGGSNLSLSFAAHNDMVERTLHSDVTRHQYVRIVVSSVLPVFFYSTPLVLVPSRLCIRANGLPSLTPWGRGVINAEPLSCTMGA